MERVQGTLKGAYGFTTRKIEVGRGDYFVHEHQAGSDSALNKSPQKDLPPTLNALPTMHLTQ